MQNENLRKRLIQAIAISYSMSYEDLIKAYQHLENIEKLLNLLETDEFENFLKEID